MDQKTLHIRTISPMLLPMELKAGIDRSSPTYTKFLRRISTLFQTSISTRLTTDEIEYETIEKDSWDQQLFIWHDKDLAKELTIHVFPNNTGVAVVDHFFDHTDDIQSLEKLAQDSTTSIIQEVYANFFGFMKEICNKQYGDFFNFDEHTDEKAKICWIARTILINSEDLKFPEIQTLAKKWLAHTYRPEDADDILSRRKSYSMTWLNYIVVDCSLDNDERIEGMILAQYYYAAQEHCNKLLKQAIDTAYNGTKKNNAQEKLSRSRVNSRLHQVDYHEHLKYLTRSKRTILEDILSCWNFDQITQNGQRMIEICSSKIDETENIKRERSSLLTDLLLVALSFFTVFELSLYLTELSREIMSRPTLDYNDESRSFIFQYIAEIDTDIMFGSGFFLTLLLVVVYKLIKSR